MERIIPNICLEWLEDGGLMAIRMFQRQKANGIIERSAVVIDFGSERLEVISAKEFLKELNMRLKIEEIRTW